MINHLMMEVTYLKAQLGPLLRASIPAAPKAESATSRPVLREEPKAMVLERKSEKAELKEIFW